MNKEPEFLSDNEIFQNFTTCLPKTQDFQVQKQYLKQMAISYIQDRLPYSIM